MKATLTRVMVNTTTTIGLLIVRNETNTYFADFKTLELEYSDNKQRESCIPIGTYTCKLRFSEKYKFHYILENVPNRSMILIHSGNFDQDTKGCILIGKSLSFDIKNREVMIQKSVLALKEFINLMGESFVLTIENNF